MLVNSELELGVVRAQIQTVEEIYRLVWTAVANKSRSKPTTRVGIDYFVGTDWAGIGRGNCAYSATNTAAKAERTRPVGSPANGRGIALK